MLKKITTPTLFTTFYVVSAYILAFTLWWAYLLYDKNETAFKEKIELNEIYFHAANSQANYKLSNEYLATEAKYHRQRFMILTEGMAFMVLMIIGLFRVRKVFAREIQLAEQQKNFMLSITHELKSPLSSIKLALQTIHQRKLEQQQSERLIHNSLGDVERLNALVDNILFAAKIDQNATGFSNSQTDISELTIDTANRFLNNKKSIAINAHIAPEVMMTIDALAFVSIVTNLIENAIKYSEDESEVTVTLRQEDNIITLTVADNGIGIEDNLKEKVFEKFYRIGSEETRSTKGTGLGLYLVNSVVKIYKGTVDVSDNKPRGTIFTITLPSSLLE